MSFAADKARVLARVDLSRKGSVDAAISPLLGYLNGQDCYYSTSSCSGRLVVYSEVAVRSFSSWGDISDTYCRVESRERRVATGYWCHMTPWM